MKIKSFRLSFLFLFFITITAVPTLAQTMITVIGTGNPAIDVLAIQDAVDTYDIVKLKGEFRTNAPIVINRYVIIEGVGTSSNDGSEVPLSYSSEVPTTRIYMETENGYVPMFRLNTSFKLRNLWMETNAGAVRNGEFTFTPSNEPFTCENNVIIGDNFGIVFWNAMHGVNILNNYINVKGRIFDWWPEPGQPVSWSNIMLWAPEYMTADMNIVGNYLKYNNVRWALEFGGPAYSSKTNFSYNHVTGTTSFNYSSSYGDANLRFVGHGGAEFIAMSNTFEDIDSPSGCGILLKAVSSAIVMNNKFKNLTLGTCHTLNWETGVIYALARSGVGTKGCTIMCNDYSQSNQPGWTAATPDGPGCVLLDEASFDNVVAECLFPAGTTAYEQIWDLGINNQLLTCLDGSIYLINELISEVESLVEEEKLKKSQGNGLTAKLNEALKNLTKSKPNEQVTCNKLGDFEDQVNAYITSGILTPADGQWLISVANIVMIFLCGQS